MKIHKATRPRVRISISRSVWLACFAVSLLNWLWSSIGLTQSPTARMTSTGTSSTNPTRRAIGLVRLAQTAFEHGDYERALTLCRQASAVAPRYARAYTWMGAVYEKRGQTMLARQVYRRVLALAPDSPDAKHSRRRLRLLTTTGSTTVSPNSGKGSSVEGSAQSPTSSIRVLVNNDALPGTVAPIIRKGRVLVPMRAMFEKLGADVQFDDTAKTVIAYRGQSQVKMKIGRPLALINQRLVTLEQAPLLESGTVMVPLRFVAEAMRAKVSWNGRNLIRISTPQPAPTIVASRPSNTLDGPFQGNSVTAPQPTAPQRAASPEPRTERTQPDLSIEENASGVPAEKLLVTGQLRPAHDAARVLGRPYSPAFLLSEQDGHLTFQLNKKWQWFEAQMAVPDKSPSSIAEIEGWLDNSPHKTSFKKLRLRANQEAVFIRIQVAGASQLTLAPIYPGYPVLIINPRFLP